MKIVDLYDGLVLGKDLFVGNQILMKKGSALNPRIISLLKKHRIQFVCIQSNEVEQLQEENLVVSENVVELQKKLVIEDSRYNPNFLLALAELSTDIRYGNALKDLEDIIYVRDLFEKYMKNVRYRAMLLALGRHDYYSYMHALDVFTLCTLFAKKEGLRNIENYAIGFLFHDIGKLKTPIEILEKEDKLSNKEFDKMKEHTQNGYEILCEVKLESVAYLAKLHHERIDGSGYPEGLTATALPMEVLILQLIDIYSTITLNRSYKAEIGAAEAIAMMHKEKHLLDEELFERFVDFIGIHPLLPSEKRLDVNKLFILPSDFRRTIH